MLAQMAIELFCYNDVRKISKCIHYRSRKTTPAEKKYHIYYLEILATAGYLLGIKFKIVTHCSALTMTLQKKEPSRVTRWALLLEEFDLSIVHRPGTLLKHADELSKQPEKKSMCTYRNYSA